MCFVLSIIMANVIINFDGMFVSSVSGQSSEKESEGSIVINDPKLKTELIVSGLEFPTSIAFIDKNDFLIIEKETGLVKRVTDGKILEPLLQLTVSGQDGRGLLGIDIDKKQYTGFEVIYVYLSYVECESKESCESKVVRYELDNENNKLIYPKEIFSIKSFPDDSNVGGVVKVGPDHNVYVTVGDFTCTDCPPFETLAENFENSIPPDGRAGILRMSPDGEPIDNGIIGKESPLNLYFAYGVRNSFGIDFDPLTGYLWDTENGPDYGDEINLVEPGFNSGALKIFGKSESNSNSNYEFDNVVQSSSAGPDGLVTFNGTGRYSEPELSWQETVAPTSVAFLDSNTLGNNYRNDMFVSTAGGGKIYNFDLSQDRKQLALKNELSDKVVDSNVEEDSITFAEGFTMITDLEVNPYDGSLYVVSPVDGDSAAGSVYKIVSTSPPEPIQDPVSPNNIIQDPASPENTITFPSGIESRQGDQLKNIEDKNTTNNDTNNNDLSICNKLKSFDNVLSDTWIERKITDEQVMYLGQQVKELMVEAGCIN
ncbi:MAG: PQQ-dependent sugar dehydrogenase [Nitrososphaeraceae archaeon]|nr:PQQ-dependent sugar dehydrogenase [Nitrososphaeraceae archaeon]